MPQPPTKAAIEEATARFLEIGVGPGGTGHVIIRSGAMGAYVTSRKRPGRWVDAYWTELDDDKIVDVTGKTSAVLLHRRNLFIFPSYL